MKLLGSKYQTYINDELVVLRIIKIKNENTYVLKDKDNNKVIMTSKELNECILLEPDAFLNIFSSIDEQDLKDVYVCVNKSVDLVANKQLPALVIRQCIYNNTKNMAASLQSSNDIYLGDCFLNVEGVNIEEILQFKDINDSISLALYIDDSLDDIFDCIGKEDEKINETLKELKENTNLDNYNVLGICDTLRQLMEDNDFMTNFRYIFNITQVNFPIEIEDTIIEDGIVKINNKQKELICKIVGYELFNISVIEYDKDIDISKIVSKSHIVIADSNNKIYLISYVLGQPLVNDNNEDIIRAMLGK